MFNSYEKIERVLYQTGNLQLKNVVIFGSKTSEGKKAEPINTRNYPSSKYTNKNELKSTTIKSSDFLTFFYNDYENNLKEEIFLSYTHLDDLENFLSEIIELLETEGVFDDNTKTVSSQYSQVLISSNPFGSGKCLHAFPDTFVNADDVVEYGITLVLGREEYAVTMSLKGFNGLIRIINTLNLLTNSNQLIQIGLLDSIERSTRNGGGNFTSTVSTRTDAFTGGGLSGRTPLGKRGIGGRTGINKGNRFSSDKFKNPSKINKEIEEESTGSDVYAQSEGASVTDNVVPNRSKSPLGIGNVLNTAKEIQLEESDDIDL